MTSTVVIPLFNKEQYITATLESLLGQRRQPDEIIIVDDASTDTSLRLAKAFINQRKDSFKGRFELIELKENWGPGKARNVGLEMATGDLISFLDADDIYHPDFIFKVSEVFQDQQTDFMVLNIKYLPGEEVYPKLERLEKYLLNIRPDLYQILNPLNAVASPDFIMGVGGNVVVKRSLITERYSETSFLNEGIDFWYRVLKSIVRRNGDKGVLLLTGEYLQVREVAGSLSRKKYVHFREPELPPLVQRYWKSNDLNDLLLMGMIGRRWFVHCLESIPSVKQKLLFLFYFSYLLPYYVRYLFLRKFYS